MACHFYDCFSGRTCHTMMKGYPTIGHRMMRHPHRLLRVLEYRECQRYTDDTKN